MNVSSAAGVVPPSYEDFEVLKETYLQVAALSPFARIYEGTGDNKALYLSTERIIPELDEQAALQNELIINPYIVRLLGKISVTDHGHKILLRYKEMPLRAGMRQSGLVHDYILGTEAGEVTEFGQSIRAIPEMPQQRIMSKDILTSDEKLDQVEAGERILRHYTGGQLELNAGDCGVLFDRIYEYFL